MDTPKSKRSSWAWYQAPIAEFLAETNDSVIGALATGSQFPITPAQRLAWQAEVDLLKSWLDGVSGEVLLEFTIPRLGGRIDAVVLTGPWFSRSNSKWAPPSSIMPRSLKHGTTLST